MSECGSTGCGCSTKPISPAGATTQTTVESAEAVYRIENMDCPTEEALIRGKLAGCPA